MLLSLSVDFMGLGLVSPLKGQNLFNRDIEMKMKNNKNNEQ